MLLDPGTLISIFYLREPTNYIYFDRTVLIKFYSTFIADCIIYPISFSKTISIPLCEFFLSFSINFIIPSTSKLPNDLWVELIDLFSKPY